MTTKDIIVALDTEIARLQHARTLSAEARAKIAAAQRQRWAKAKKG
jgi:hypothetical protein